MSFPWHHSKCLVVHLAQNTRAIHPFEKESNLTYVCIAFDGVWAKAAWHLCPLFLLNKDEKQFILWNLNYAHNVCTFPYSEKGYLVKRYIYTATRMTASFHAVKDSYLVLHESKSWNNLHVVLGRGFNYWNTKAHYSLTAPIIIIIIIWQLPDIWIYKNFWVPQRTCCWDNYHVKVSVKRCLQPILLLWSNVILSISNWSDGENWLEVTISCWLYKDKPQEWNWTQPPKTLQYSWKHLGIWNIFLEENWY